MGRTQNVGRNIYWGIMNRIVSILLPFLVRTALLYKLGTEYLGLSSLFTSVLSVLSLTELGFGQALVYSMYEPMAKKETKKINALLVLYNKCYKIIGLAILALGVCFVPFLPKLIYGEVPGDVNLYVLYIVYLFNTVLSYFLFAYKKSIFYASQRTDIDSNINTMVSVFQNLFQIIVVLLFANYYVYIIFLPMATLVNNIWVSLSVKKRFPEFKCEGSLGKEEIKYIFKDVKGLVFQKIGGVVLLSLDNIVVSAFLGLNTLAVYNNYYYVVTALTGILSIITNALKPSVGNSMVTESLEKNYNDFNKLNFAYLWIVAWCTITMLNLYQPFIRIWTGEALMLSNSLAFLFALYFFINKWCDMMYVYQEAAGLWYENRFVPLLAAVLNLILNILLVQVIGLAGILVSTIMSILLIYNTGYAYVLFKYYFKDISKMGTYFSRQFEYVLTFVIIGILTYFVCSKVILGDYASIFVRGVICIFFPNLLAVFVFRRTENFKGIQDIMKRLVRHK